MRLQTLGELSGLSSVRTGERHTEGVCAEVKWWQTVHQGDEREHVTSGGRGYIREMSVSVLQVAADGTSGR